MFKKEKNKKMQNLHGNPRALLRANIERKRARFSVRSYLRASFDHWLDWKHNHHFEEHIEKTIQTIICILVVVFVAWKFTWIFNYIEGKLALFKEFMPCYQSQFFMLVDFLTPLFAVIWLATQLWQHDWQYNKRSIHSFEEQLLHSPSKPRYI
ncbi:Oidioi.mRNA.OKI2018_I69.XSR.g13248.t1.cds [Oikopleura dioica]|uniref:Oidioi.mRNA.OKI2018_I69.XSR.g13248.t1.cds n=1 Tax=Oikopleura dioica TaxID=34765 RepID=A0ABN7S6C6_OIKDI|nr:Oidioi.mRNA.OKI2018_I69.XSR.g13248.t1.cds [Oikopleura dioica]